MTPSTSQADADSLDTVKKATTVTEQEIFWEPMQKFRATLREVMGFQCPAFISQVASCHACSEEEARQLWFDLMRFFFLKEFGGEKFAPPRIIDRTWQEFLIHDTAGYSTFCARFFSRFVHYKSALDEDLENHNVLVQHTIGRARQVFGRLSPNWTT